MTTPYRKKLIEVDLPLAAISKASAREKTIREGQPSTMHLWWARRPLAACRAVLFASMVDDPSALPDEFPTDEAQRRERLRLHSIIESLVKWDESNNELLLAEARYEIAQSVARSRGERAPASADAVLAYLRDHAPPVYDPFAGGGSIPLEAQRLGLRAVASDLNPVAVLINKALIELPPKVAGKPPVNPDARRIEGAEWRGAAGLADDIRYYGKWMRDRAFEDIGHLYPKIKLQDGSESTVILWLWARTIPCSNPACGAPMPLIKSFRLSKKKGREHWFRPVVDAVGRKVSFVVQDHDGGVPKESTVDRNGAKCLVCGSVVPLAYAREQAKAGKMGEQMLAVVAEGKRGRLFFSPTDEYERIALSAEPKWRISQKMPATAHLVSGRGYGITRWSELFTERQLTALTTFSDLIGEVGNLVKDDASDDYANTVCTYLSLALGKLADCNSSFSTYHLPREHVSHVFARQAIPMVWDYAESNPFCNSAGNWSLILDKISKVLMQLPKNIQAGEAYQTDATTSQISNGPVICTDPPYYDNISYAELSDFFYVWLRSALRETYPDLFSGMLVPIDEEMTAVPRFENARERFEELLGKSLRLMRDHCSDDIPSSIFYAYKQQEEEREGRSSTGWEMMLSALIQAGFQIVGTWPMRTELGNRSNAMEANTLTTSVVLVCRPRAEAAPVGDARRFREELGRELPTTLDKLMHDGHIDPVDLRQAAIGPGMQVYSRYARIERLDGAPYTVRDALQEINRAVDFYTERDEGELDARSRFCLVWLRTHGHAKRQFGDAEGLAKPMNVSVEALADNGLLSAERGEVALYEVGRYSPDEPMRGEASAWEAAYRMAWHFSDADGHGGVDGAAEVALALADGVLDQAKRLADLVYDVYDRRSDSRAASAFNDLAADWEKILRGARTLREGRQGRLG